MTDPSRWRPTTTLLVSPTEALSTGESSCGVHQSFSLNFQSLTLLQLMHTTGWCPSQCIETSALRNVPPSIHRTTPTGAYNQYAVSPASSAPGYNAPRAGYDQQAYHAAAAASQNSYGSKFGSFIPPFIRSRPFPDIHPPHHHSEHPPK